MSYQPPVRITGILGRIKIHGFKIVPRLNSIATTQKHAKVIVKPALVATMIFFRPYLSDHGPRNKLMMAGIIACIRLDVIIISATFGWMRSSISFVPLLLLNSEQFVALNPSYKQVSFRRIFGTIADERLNPKNNNKSAGSS